MRKAQPQNDAEREGGISYETLHCPVWNGLLRSNIERKILMAVPDSSKIYPRTGDMQTVFLKNVVSRDVQRGPAADRKILFHRLRSKIPVQQRKPYPAFSVNLPFPALL